MGFLTAALHAATITSEAMPHVSVNFATSADGKISGAARQPSGWTSELDFARLIELRKPADALLVGRGTLATDRMTLTVPGTDRQPLRCVVSRNGKLDASLPVFTREGGAIHLLVTGDAAADVPPGVTVHRGGIREFLEMLETAHGVRHVHCEGGGELVKALADEDLIDEIHQTWAGHTLFGGREALTTPDVLWINLPGVWGVNLSALYAAGLVEPGLGLAAPYLMIVNGLAHIAMAAKMRCYNPGLATGVEPVRPARFAAR